MNPDGFKIIIATDAENRETVFALPEFWIAGNPEQFALMVGEEATRLTRSMLGLPEPDPMEQYGWRCGECGWETFSLAVMAHKVNRLNADKSITPVCPSCGAEGKFVDAVAEVEDHPEGQRGG